MNVSFPFLPFLISLFFYGFDSVKFLLKTKTYGEKGVLLIVGFLGYLSLLVSIGYSSLSKIADNSIAGYQYSLMYLIAVPTGKILTDLAWKHEVGDLKIFENEFGGFFMRMFLYPIATFTANLFIVLVYLLINNFII